MKVIGFNFDKISAEKLKDRPDNLKISTNIDIVDIKDVKTDILKTKEQLLHAKFSHTIKYEPGFANMELKGTVLLTLEEKEAKEVLKEWKKKQMPEGFRITLFNIILRKSAIKALQLEEELNLPLHISLPVLRSGKEKEK